MDPTTPLHIVAIPYPGRGHINPMLNLCRTLLSSSANLLVSFIATEEWVHLITTEEWVPSNLRFVPIPNVLPSESTRGADFKGFLQAVHTKMEGSVESALMDGAHSPPVDFVVADSGLPWAAEICRRRGLPVASLFPQSASVLRALLRFGSLHKDGQLPLNFSGKDDKVLAYIPRVATPHFSSLLSNVLDRNVIVSGYIEKNFWFTIAQSLLLSSFYELESHAIDELKSNLSLPIYVVGPSIPYMTLADPPVKTNTEISYLKWLDSQPSCSVLYISLGSFLSASNTQVDEMVMGLNASGIRYLWVARDENQQLKGLNGELGMVVPWCYQLRVLCHPSVGGFLSHCGWGSTMEGIYAGVPMLTYPLIWDQYPNSKQIVDVWKIGLRLKDEDEEGEKVIGKEEVARMVRELMDLDGEESKRRRRRAAELKEQCRQCLREGGSSSTSLDAFVQGMISQKLHTKTSTADV